MVLYPRSPDDDGSGLGQRLKELGRLAPVVRRQEHDLDALTEQPDNALIDTDQPARGALPSSKMPSGFHGADIA